MCFCDPVGIVEVGLSFAERVVLIVVLAFCLSFELGLYELLNSFVVTFESIGDVFLPFLSLLLDL